MSSVRGFSVSHDTWLDERKRKKRQNEALNRERLSVHLLRECKGSKVICSGSIVKVKSEVLNCGFCLLTSDVFPPGDIEMNDYYIEFWTSDLKSVNKRVLSKVAVCPQSSQVKSYRSSSGLVLIPTKQKKSSVCDDKRSFPTAYYNVDKETKGGDISLQCHIVGTFQSSGDSSLPEESFTLITNRDQDGQLKYELRDADGTVFKTYKDFKTRFSHLYPHGGAILKGKGEQGVCIGVLNFSPEGLISPTFLTQASLTDPVQLFHPSSVVSTDHEVIAKPDIKTQVVTRPKDVDLTTLKVEEKSNCEMRQQGQIGDQETLLLQNANANGYQIRSVKIPGDGNCLFHAVADQLECLRVPGHTYESLRKLAVQELQDNLKDNHLEMNLPDVVENNDPVTYLQKMSRDGTWGGHMELVALSHALQKTIIVVTSSQTMSKHEIGNFTGLPIVLGHLGEHHYKSLERLQSPNHMDGHGSVKASEAALSSSSRHSLVTGRDKVTHPQYQTIVPEYHNKGSGNPSLNEDVTSYRCSNDYGFTQKEEYTHLQNINYLSTKCREMEMQYNKKCEECNQLQWKSEFDGQKIKHQNERISELHFNLRTIQEENEELRAGEEERHAKYEKVVAENKQLHTKIKELHTTIKVLISQNYNSVFGDDSSSSTGSNKVETEDPSGTSANCRQRVSSSSSDEEYVDASSELGSPANSL